MATARCTWTAVSGVDGYNVYLKSNGTFVKQNSELVTETVYDIENLEDGDYEACATSVLNDVESEASNVKGFNLVSVATPVIESVSTDQFNGALSSRTLDKPAGTQEGDLLLLSFGGRRGNPGSNYTMVYPSGWTEIAAINAGTTASDSVQFMAYKIATGDEPTSYTFTTQMDGSNISLRSTSAILRISGANSTSPIVSHSTNSGATGDMVGLSINTTANNLLILTGVVSEVNATPNIATPIDMVSHWFLINGTSGSARTGHRGASKEVGAGATGDIETTRNGANYTCFLVAVGG